MSPLLFNLYTAKLEKRLKKREIGGIRVGRFRFWSLAYADNVVLIAKNREAMQDMEKIETKKRNSCGIIG